MALLSAQQQQAPQQEASPEEQQMLQEAYNYAAKFLYSDAFLPKLKQMFQQYEPTKAIARILALTILRVEKKFGLEDDIKLELAQNLVPELVQLAVDIGVIKKEQVDETLFTNIVTAAVEEYALMKEQTGEPLDPNQARKNTDEMVAEGTVTEGINAMSNGSANDIRKLLKMAQGG